MKVRDLKRKEPTVDVCIGYDDHCSIYRVTLSQLKAVADMTDVDAINDELIGGKYVGSSCERGDIFFDLMNGDVAEFQNQVQEYLGV